MEFIVKSNFLEKTFQFIFIFSIAIMNVSSASAASAVKGKEKKSIPTTFDSIPSSNLPENSAVLDQMRERLVITDLAKEREKEESDRKERVRKALGTILDTKEKYQENSNNPSKDMNADSKTLKPASSRETKQDKIRDLQSLMIKQALLRFKSEQDGLGEATANDRKILRSLLCEESDRFARMAPYRDKLSTEVGPSALKIVSVGVCAKAKSGE